MCEIKQEAPEEVKMILVGNKSDLSGNRIIEYNQGVELAKEYNIDFYETSASNGENVKKIFHRIGELILEDLGEQERSGKLRLSKKKWKSKCCK